MLYNIAVAPFAGAWIEIVTTRARSTRVLQSLPSRERGLKSADLNRRMYQQDVAPFAGAWIEIDANITDLRPDRVAPFAGAWIEILLCDCFMGGYTRRSLRGSVD